MSNTAIQTTPPAGPVAAAPPRSARALKHNLAWAIVRAVLRVLASLRLTVFLFVLALILVFCGTLAQTDAGIGTVISKYFRTFEVVWIPFQIFVRLGQVFFGVSKSAEVPGSFPFPGGWLIGAALLANLLAAHLIRFRVSWKRSGILLIHSGLIIMLASELITGVFAVEGSMIISQNGSSNYLVHQDNPEVVVIDPSDPKNESVVSVPASLLRKGGRIGHDLLPFDLEVVRYMQNSADPVYVGPGVENPATAGAGLELVAVEKPEGRGTDANQKANLASAYVTLWKKGTDESLGTYLLSVWLHDWPESVSVNGKTYLVNLRPKRTYKPYTIHLIEFRHDKYVGTETARNYSSRVRLVDPSRGESQETIISMNQPLRYRGETFYQQSFLEGNSGTVLQVVRNPGWLLPYVSCALVSLGMVVHFGLNLMGFVRKRVAA